jgi:hypothetical protein
VNDPAIIQKLRRTDARKLVFNANAYVTTRARRFVWAHDGFPGAIHPQ